MTLTLDQEIAITRAKGALEALDQLCSADIRTGDQVTVSREALGYLFNMVVRELKAALPN